VREPHDELLIVNALHVLVGVELVLKLTVVGLVSFVYQLTKIVSCKWLFDFEIIHFLVHFFSFYALLSQYSLLRCLIIIFIASNASSRAHIALSTAAISITLSKFPGPFLKISAAVSHFKVGSRIKKSIIMRGISVGSHLHRVVRISPRIMLSLILSEIARITHSCIAIVPRPWLSDLGLTSEMLLLWGICRPYRLVPLSEIWGWNLLPLSVPGT
jgi:hypothetical protein